jgi:hypothetical protein
MNRLLILPVLLLTLLVGNPAFSADFQKGLTAYNSGDFATALREWEPLAEQGMPLPSPISVLCTAKDKAFHRTIRLR